MSQDPTTSRPGRVPEPSQKNKSPAPEQKRPQQPQSNEEQTWYGLLAFVVIMALFLGGLGITIARSFF
jgi:thiol:disulfide interchange protein